MSVHDRSKWADRLTPGPCQWCDSGDYPHCPERRKVMAQESAARWKDEEYRAHSRKRQPKLMREERELPPVIPPLHAQPESSRREIGRTRSRSGRVRVRREGGPR